MIASLAITFRNLAIGYLAIGAVVCLIHPKIIRDHIATLKNVELGAVGFILKSIMALAVFSLACLIWPIAWFNVGKSEKKAKEALDAQLERLRPFMMLEAAMSAPVQYSGGDGSSIDQAVVLNGATIASGPRAAYNFIEERFPGCVHRRQSLREQGGRSYDVLEFTTADGEERTMYFDITDQFLKPMPPGGQRSNLC